MKKVFLWISVAMVAIGMTRGALAEGEHGGVEHAGTEHAGTALASTPSDEDIRNAIRGYIEQEAAKTEGYFEVFDPQGEAVRRLSLERVHDRVGKTGDYYYSCADFKDADSGEMLDLDLDVEEDNGALSIVDVRIHKLNGSPRYTYDENDNRIPIPVVEALDEAIGDQAQPIEMDEEEEEFPEGNITEEQGAE